MRKVGYNCQRDNFTIDGIPGSSQCFATSAWMFLSFYSPHYAAGDDVGLKQYISDVTATNSTNEYEWAAHQAMITKYMSRAGVSGTVKLGINLDNGNGLLTPTDLYDKLTIGPVIIGTKKMAGLPGGHIILGVDVAPNGAGVICNDPYGSALTGYSDHNGEAVIYPVTMFDSENPASNVRCIYLI